MRTPPGPHCACWWLSAAWPSLASCKFLPEVYSLKGIVTDSKEEVCVDPGEKGAILEDGRPGPPGGGKGWQLASDSGGEET